MRIPCRHHHHRCCRHCCRHCHCCCCCCLCLCRHCCCGVKFSPFPRLNCPRGKAIAPLHRCGVAEPELLVHDVGGVPTRAGNISPQRPRHCPYHGCCCCCCPEMGGVPPTIAPYSLVVVLLLVIVVLALHCLDPTPPSVVIAVIIGAPPGAAQHVKEVGGLIHWEPLLVQFLDLVAIGWAEGELAVRPPLPPVRLVLLLLVPTFLPIFIQGMATQQPTTCGLIARQPGYCRWAATTSFATTRTTMTPEMVIAMTAGRAEDSNGTNSGGTHTPPPNDDIVIA